MAEEFFDRLAGVVLLLLTGLLLRFVWTESLLRCCEYRARQFLELAAETGIVTEIGYEKFLSELLKYDPGCTVQLAYQEMQELPVFACYSRQELTEYFALRNKRTKKEPEILRKEQSIEQLYGQAKARKLQTETAEQWLGRLELPLPASEKQEGTIWKAVQKEQTVYLGEELITLCLVWEDGVWYWEEADAISLWEEGNALVELCKNGMETGAFISVRVVPRICFCERGHGYLFTIEQEAGQETRQPCPVCYSTPERLVVKPAVISLREGETLAEAGVRGEVTYQDGRREEIVPGESGWKDNHDAGYYGIQTVTVTFRDRVKTEITVISKAVSCESCGGEIGCRSYADIAGYPACADCLAGQRICLGEKKRELVETDENGIRSEWSKGDFRMRQGGELSVTVTFDNGRSVREKMMIRTGEAEK